MKRNFFAVPALALLLSAMVSGQQTAPSSAESKKAVGVPDPRFSPRLAMIFHKGESTPYSDLGDALLIFARIGGKNPNTILGIDGSFRDDQIVAGLKRFYREWRPPVDQPTIRPPHIILASQDWGARGGLDEQLKSLSAEYGIDIYLYHPVITAIAPHPSHPTPNDKRLCEILNAK